MKTVAVPKLTLSFEVDVEVAYNSFGGKTANEIADSLQDEIHDMLFELEQVQGVCSKCTSLDTEDS
jgi:hypothetical protein